MDPEITSPIDLGLAQLQASRLREARRPVPVHPRVRQDFPDAWVGLASALEGQGLPDEALAALDQAIARAGDHVGALFNAALLARKSGRLDVCHRARTPAGRSWSQTTARALCMLGASLRDSDRKDEAERRFRDALAFEPSHLEAKTSLALMLKEQRSHAQACTCLFDLVDSMPSDANMRLVLSESLHGVALPAAGPRIADSLDLCMDDSHLSRTSSAAIVESITDDEGFRVCCNSGTRRRSLRFDGSAVAAYLTIPS